jgi:hypothetical protein
MGDEMIKLVNVNRWTVGQMVTEDLKEALVRTRDKQKQALIQAELDSRKATGVDRPLRIEDFLG